MHEEVARKYRTLVSGGGCKAKLVKQIFSRAAKCFCVKF